MTWSMAGFAQRAGGRTTPLHKGHDGVDRSHTRMQLAWKLPWPQGSCMAMSPGASSERQIGHSSASSTSSTCMSSAAPDGGPMVRVGRNSKSFTAVADACSAGAGALGRLPPRLRVMKLIATTPRGRCPRQQHKTRNNRATILPTAIAMMKLNWPKNGRCSTTGTAGGAGGVGGVGVAGNTMAEYGKDGGGGGLGGEGGGLTQGPLILFWRNASK
mmetsp:Transcript_29931/g.69809  ORF Transcript_29931/g.69809 Transcript_29931/m.69809 type:complete len:215 (-) Transcript_29931:308-952(-)